MAGDGLRSSEVPDIVDALRLAVAIPRPLVVSLSRHAGDHNLDTAVRVDATADKPPLAPCRPPLFTVCCRLRTQDRPWWTTTPSVRRQGGDAEARAEDIMRWAGFICWRHPSLQVPLVWRDDCVPCQIDRGRSVGVSST